MKLDMGEQARERPVIEDGVKEQPQNVKPELEKQLSLEEDNTSAPQWNIPREGGVAPLEQLMSQLTLAHNATPRMRSLCRLVRVALSRADRRELRELAETATNKARPEEFVRHLGKLLDKEAGRQKDDVSVAADCAKQTAGQRATPTSTGEGAKVQTARPKKFEELKEGNDLCPRSPMRPQHHRPNNFPYQNTSRNHHSGGMMSAVAYSNAVGPTPQYHDHMSFQGLGSVASRPPLIAESSNVPLETTLDDLDSMNLSEEDLEILMYIAADMCPKIPPSLDDPFLPTVDSTQQPNSDMVSDRRVPNSDLEGLFSSTLGGYSHPYDGGYCSLSPASLPSHPYDGGYCSLSPASLPSHPYDGGYCSLSPASLPAHSPGPAAHLPSSPDSMRVVPDDSAPNMSPPGQFFEDNLPLTGNYDTGVYDKEVGGYHSPGSSGYSSTSAPSPTDYSSANEFAREDFTKMQIPSNNYIYNLDGDFDSDYLLENVFESSPSNACKPQSIFFGNATNATANTTRNRLSPYPAHVYTSPSTNANVSAQENANANVPSTVAQFETGNAIADFAENANTFAELTNAVVDFAPSCFTMGGGVAYLESTAVNTVNADNVTLAMPTTLQAKLTSPSVNNLKRLEPKVQHFLRPETGRERILKLMDKKKKAEAWVTISLKINEVAKQDKDGDTQLMILCANTAGSVQSYVLEYTYAMVEMLKGIPRSLSAVNNQRQSAIYLAAIHSDYANRAIVVRYIAETLIELGEDVACTMEGGDSMLHELCRQGDQRYDVLVELLSLKNQAGQPYFDVNQYNAMGLTPLHVAVKSHGVNNVSTLMTVQLLMAERADILLPDKVHSHTALHTAILESCAPRLIQALLRGGTQSGRVCNMLNLKRDSPLHCAASRNELPVAQQMKVIQLLLEHGAVKSLNANGKFPIALVAEERRQEIRRVYETRKSNQANV